MQALVHGGILESGREWTRAYFKAATASPLFPELHGLIQVSTEDPMPFKSQAQRRKFAQLLVAGKISNETFEEWNRETGSKKLPERVTKNSRTPKKSGAGTKRRRGTKRS